MRLRLIGSLGSLFVMSVFIAVDWASGPNKNLQGHGGPPPPPVLRHRRSVQPCE